MRLLVRKQTKLSTFTFWGASDFMLNIWLKPRDALDFGPFASGRCLMSSDCSRWQQRTPGTLDESKLRVRFIHSTRSTFVPWCLQYTAVESGKKDLKTTLPGWCLRFQTVQIATSTSIKSVCCPNISLANISFRFQLHLKEPFWILKLLFFLLVLGLYKF